MYITLTSDTLVQLYDKLDGIIYVLRTMHVPYTIGSVITRWDCSEVIVHIDVDWKMESFVHLAISKYM